MNYQQSIRRQKIIKLITSNRGTPQKKQVVKIIPKAPIIKKPKTKILDFNIPNIPIVIYTANYGDYDTIKKIQMPPNVKCISFSDKERCSDGWESIVFNDFPSEYTPIMKAKYIKIFPELFLPKSEISIWLDSSIEVKSNALISMLCNNTTDTNGMCLYQHPVRKSIIEEARQILTYDHLKHLNVTEQVNHYLSDGINPLSGLYFCGIIARKSCENSRKISSLWWDEIQKWTIRDQISLPFVLWKNNLNVDIINKSYYKKDFFIKHEHNK